MLYCADCREEFDLAKTAFILFGSECDLCGKKTTFCHFVTQEEEEEGA